MKISVLGCSGGVSGNLRTTCLLVDDDILIDAGTGAGDLSLEQMARIDHIFLTHSHLDHVALVPLLADAVAGKRESPIIVHALPETNDTLKQCVLNWKLWPDYTVMPSKDRPYIRFDPIKLGLTVELAGRKITPLPAKHAVPAVGYQLDSGAASLVFSGDTTYCEAFWEAINAIPNLVCIMIESTFLDRNAEGAVFSGHMTPSLVAKGLNRLARPASIYITHMEPGRQEETMHEIMAVANSFKPLMLKEGQVIEF